MFNKSTNSERNESYTPPPHPPPPPPPPQSHRPSQSHIPNRNRSKTSQHNTRYDVRLARQTIACSRPTHVRETHAVTAAGKYLTREAHFYSFGFHEINDFCGGFNDILNRFAVTEITQFGRCTKHHIHTVC